MLKIKIILGSTRQNRFSDKPGRWILEEAKNKEGIDAELLDLRNYPLPFYNEPVSPAMVKDGAYPNDIVRRFAAKIKEADAFIIIAPEYNHGISGVLKNALDSIYVEWNNKPVGFVAYGGVGGARSVEHLRGVAIELQMAPIRNAIHNSTALEYEYRILGFTLDVIGKIMVAYTAIAVHHRFWKKHKIDKAVFAAMKNEQVIGIAGIILIIVGYLLQVPSKI